VVAAANPNVYVLDEENAFNLHYICDSSADANGIILWPFNPNNSFHPNRAGDTQMAADLNRAAGQLP
jgi:hypothetical protein